MAAGTRAVSLTGHDLSSAEMTIARFGGTMRQLVPMPASKIEAIEQKAFDRSNRIQPDLASMMLVEFENTLDEKQLLAAARQLNDLDVIQWVEIEQPLKRASAGPPPQGCGPGAGGAGVGRGGLGRRASDAAGRAPPRQAIAVFGDPSLVPFVKQLQAQAQGEVLIREALQELAVRGSVGARAPA